MKKLWISLCGALLAAAGQAHATTYYVALGGNDGNAGTSATTAWQTFSHATPLLKPGDTLLVVGGTYTEPLLMDKTESGTANNPITISNYNNVPVIIDGSSRTVTSTSVNSLIGIDASYINISGFQLQNLLATDPTVSAFGVHTTGQNVIVSNMVVHDIWSHGIIVEGDNSTIKNSTVYQVSLENCRKGGTAACGSTAARWSGCLSAGSDYGKGVITHHATIKDNTVYNCWGEGISTYLSDSTIIQDNVTYDNWAENLYVNNATNALVQRNLVYNTPNNAVGQVAPFSLADEAANTGTANNLSGYNTIIDNIVYNCPFSAFSWTNVNGTGLNHVVIANNTFVDPYAFPDPNTHAFNTGSGGTNNITNTSSQIFNNIVDGTVYVPAGSPGITFQSNLWSNSPPSTARGTGDVTGNPMLVAGSATGPGQLTGSYFELQSNSPAIGKATSLPAVTVDYFTTASATPQPDIGATETVTQDKSSTKP